MYKTKVEEKISSVSISYVITNYSELKLIYSQFTKRIFHKTTNEVRKTDLLSQNQEEKFAKMDKVQNRSSGNGENRIAVVELHRVTVWRCNAASSSSRTNLRQE